MAIPTISIESAHGFLAQILGRWGLDVGVFLAEPEELSRFGFHRAQTSPAGGGLDEFIIQQGIVNLLQCFQFWRVAMHGHLRPPFLAYLWAAPFRLLALYRVALSILR